MALVVAALVVAVGLVAAAILVQSSLAQPTAEAGPQPAKVRYWIDQTLGPLPPEQPPLGAISLASTSTVAQSLQDVTGVPLTEAGGIHAGHNYRTVTTGGRQLTVDLLPLTTAVGFVHSASCTYHTQGPRSVDRTMVTTIEQCLYAVVDDSKLSTETRAALDEYVPTGRGSPQHIGYATVTVTNNASAYGVTISGV